MALEGLLQFDKDLTSSLAVCASKDAPFGIFRPIMLVLELLGHGVPWFAGAILGPVLSHTEEVSGFCINLFAALVLDIVIVGTLKATFKRGRPSVNQGMVPASVAVDHYSFPSGHSTRAVMVSILLSHMGFMTVPAAIAFAAATCSSRLLLGRHHVLDILAGILIGAMQAWVMLYVYMSPAQCAPVIRFIQEHLHW